MTRHAYALLSHPMVRLIAVVSFSLVLAACGQGGNGGGY
jgi:hypothetical protein